MIFFCSCAGVAAPMKCWGVDVFFIHSGEFAKPEEIADAVAFLSSPSAMSIVGIDLVIDGGFTAIVKE